MAKQSGEKQSDQQIKDTLGEAPNKPPSFPLFVIVLALAIVSDFALDTAGLTGIGFIITYLGKIFIWPFLFFYTWQAGIKVSSIDKARMALVANITKTSDRVNYYTRLVRKSLIYGRKAARATSTARSVYKGARVARLSLKVSKITKKLSKFSTKAAVYAKWLLGGEWVPIINFLPMATVGIVLAYVNLYMMYKQFEKEKLPQTYLELRSAEEMAKSEAELEQIQNYYDAQQASTNRLRERELTRKYINKQHSINQTA